MIIIKKNIFCLALIFALGMTVADELRLKTGVLHQGFFLELDSKGRLSFQTFEQEEALSLPLSVIDTLTLDKPRQVSFIASRNKKKTLEAVFQGFQDGNFSLRLPGEEKNRNFQQLQIHKISAPLDMREFMLRRQEIQEQKAAATENTGRKAKTMLVPGKATVIYFKATDSDPTSRQGSLLKKLCADQPRKAICVEVPLNSLQHQTAIINDLKSLPQFWFYSADGRLAGKLIDRFTENDIEKMLRKAIKGKF